MATKDNFKDRWAEGTAAAVTCRTDEQGARFSLDQYYDLLR